MIPRPGFLGVGSRCQFVSPWQKGVFQLMNEDYFIEPVSSSPREEGAAQPHRIYKRQVPKGRAGQGRSPPGPREPCGVPGTVPSSAPTSDQQCWTSHSHLLLPGG